MPTRKSAVIIIFTFCLLFAVSRTRVLRYWSQGSKPLGNAPKIEFPPNGISQLAVENFLEGNFTIVTNVKVLPNPVLQAFSDDNDSHLLMANPGDKFEATGVISDRRVPRMRLIFAGVRNDSNFVHYEQGGRAHLFVVALFKLISPIEVEPFWRGYCTGPAHTLAELRSAVVNGSCR